MRKELTDLIEISRAVGADPALVQGGGGNTSVKSPDARSMYIKASGGALADMSEQAGWRRLRTARIISLLDDESLADLPIAERESRVVEALLASTDDGFEDDSRPSVESPLHALLGRCVIHLHPIAVGAYVCAKDGRAALERLFPNENNPPAWVPYADPGYMLAQAVSRCIERHRRAFGRAPEMMFLQNHGLLVSAETPRQALSLVRKTVSTCEKHLRLPRAPRTPRVAPEEARQLQFAVRRACVQTTGRYVAVRHFMDRTIAGFLARTDARALTRHAALTPDELAYLNGPPFWAAASGVRSLGRRLKHLVARGGKVPCAFLVPEVGLFISGSPRTLGAMKDVAVASLAIRAAAADLGGVRALSKRRRDFIAEWEGAAFRKRVAGMTDGGELAGRIALVTGAGSGLGRSIAGGLARAGASVCLVDVDLGSAEETASLIGGESPTFALQCDVTSESNVARAFDSLVEQWGGLDILVNAAGIAPAFALTDFPVDRWRRAVEVNLTGYFLMGRAAARLMTEQGMGGSIVNLSSKSGLDASKDNTAYNATKAGEIHMARGWALELGERAIRVNALAPGNVFEGSKIWNPAYIKAAARKYGIRPEEVIPYYVGKTAMKQETTGRDVADAVVFLCSDRARVITGQTLVVDAGQVMVR